MLKKFFKKVHFLLFRLTNLGVSLLSILTFSFYRAGKGIKECIEDFKGQKECVILGNAPQ